MHVFNLNRIQYASSSRKGWWHFLFPQQWLSILLVLYHHQHLIWSGLFCFCFSHCGGCIVVSYCGFKWLMRAATNSDDYWLIFQGPVQISCPLFYGVVCLSLIDLWELFLYLNMSPSSVVFVASIFSHFSCPFHPLNDVFSWIKVLNLNVPNLSILSILVRAFVACPVVKNLSLPQVHKDILILVF